MNGCLTLIEFPKHFALCSSIVLHHPIHQMVRSEVLSVPSKWPGVRATSLEPSRSICLLNCFVALHFFLSDKQKLPSSDACTELIELAFEMNKLPIGKGIGERLRKTSQDEGRYRPDKITHDEATRGAINYFK